MEPDLNGGMPAAGSNLPNPQSAPLPQEDFWDRWASFVGWAYLLLTAYYLVHWMPMVRSHLASYELRIHLSVGEIGQNLLRFLQGSANGYARTLWGSAAFGGMACAFLSFGNAVFAWIERRWGGGPRAFSRLTRAERLAVDYALGSLVASLLWFGFAMLGWLKTGLALFLWAAGVLLFCLRHGRAVLDEARNLRSHLSRKWSSWSRTEKWVAFLVAAFLFGLVPTAVLQQPYADVLLSHLGLPNLYIQHGGMIFYPYHHHSYFYQNTEMLILWALLLKSEVAAALTILGFLASLCLLAFGFLERRAGRWAALTAIPIALTPTVLVHAAIEVKNDLPVAFFLFAHFWALFEAFSDEARDGPEMTGWILLAAILLGGATGHKLIAIPAILASGAWVAGYLLSEKLRRRRGGTASSAPARKILLAWLAGLAVGILPWFLRTLWETGNPIYPLYHHFFGRDWVRSWHDQSGVGYTVERFGWRFIFDYLLSLFSGSKENGVPMPPSWGTSLGLILLCAPLLRGPGFSSMRVAVGGALIGFFLTLLSYVQIRYQIAYLTFPIIVSYAVVLKGLEERGRSALRILLPGAAVLNWIYQSLLSMTWAIMVSSSLAAVSGYAPGNFLTWDEAVNNAHAMWHLINTRTGPQDAVLFMGAPYTSGVRRKLYYSFTEDREILGELAEECPDALSLKERLLNLGVRHLVIGQTLDHFEKNPDPRLRLARDPLSRIRTLLEAEAVPRFELLNGSLRWFTLKSAEPAPPIEFTLDDAVQAPYLVVQEITRQTNLGRYAEAERLANLIAQAPVTPEAKTEGYRGLAAAYQRQGKKRECEKTLQRIVEMLPDAFDGYASLGAFYDSWGPEGRILAFQSYRQALALNPRSAMLYNNLGNLFFQEGQNEEAMRHYRKALELDPIHYDATLNVGNVLFREKRYDLALDFYQKAAQLNPRRAMSYNNMGQALFEQGLYDRAESALAKALELNPDLTYARKRLGEIYFLEKKYARSLQEYRAAARLDPGDLEVRRRIAQAGRFVK